MLQDVLGAGLMAAIFSRTVIVTFKDFAERAIRRVPLIAVFRIADGSDE
jgi:hypothetical protein